MVQKNSVEQIKRVLRLAVYSYQRRPSFWNHEAATKAAMMLDCGVTSSVIFRDDRDIAQHFEDLPIEEKRRLLDEVVSL